MSDESLPGGPQGGSGDDGTPTGAELDRLLAEAADLAAEVTAEVGALPVRPYFENVPIDSLEPDGMDIQEKLGELETMLERTATEVGAGSGSTSRQTTPQGAMPVPDFMAEFMDAEQPGESFTAKHPENRTSSEILGASPRDLPGGHPEARTEPGSSSTAPENDKKPSPPVPEFMAEFTQPDAHAGTGHSAAALTPPHVSRNPPKLGVVGSPITPISLEDLPEEEPIAGIEPEVGAAAPIVVTQGGPAVALRSAPPPEAKATNNVEESGIKEALGTRGSPLFSCAARVVQLIESIDRFFSWIGMRARQVIGVVGLIFLGASVMVLVAAML